MNEILTNYYNIRDQHDKSLSVLEKEVTRIVEIIKAIFKRKSAWWSYKYYEGDETPLPNKINDGYFEIHISESCDSGVWFYNESFPITFFDMSNQEITDYIKKEIVETLEKEVRRAKLEEEKKDLKKQKIQQLKQSAASKLNKEERKALGL